MTLLFLSSMAAFAAPDPLSDCETLGQHYQRQTRPRPIERPELWWLEQFPCPTPFELAGKPPPDGEAVWCADRRQRRQGPRTEFKAGRIVLFTSYYNDDEQGRRVEWDAQGQVSRTTEMRADVFHGERVEFTVDGGVTITTFDRGEQSGATWRFDEHGALLVVEHWAGGKRSGRSCTWRDGQVDTDQLWKDGAPVADPLMPSIP